MAPSLEDNADLHPTALVKAISHELVVFGRNAEQADDITMLALEFGVAPNVSDTMVVPAKVDELGSVLGFVNGELVRRLCPLKTQSKIDIAIEELFVNVAHYAYPEATEENPGEVRVTYVYNATPPRITVQLSDKGIPFNPLERPTPVQPENAMEAKIGGLGVFMAKKSVDELTYNYEEGHNVVTLSKSW